MPCRPHWDRSNDRILRRDTVSNLHSVSDEVHNKVRRIRYLQAIREPSEIRVILMHSSSHDKKGRFARYKRRQKTARQKEPGGEQEIVRLGKGWIEVKSSYLLARS